MFGWAKNAASNLMGLGAKGYQQGKGVLAEGMKAGGTGMLMRGMAGAAIGGAIGAGYDGITGKKGSAASMASGGFLLGAAAGLGRNWNKMGAFAKDNPGMKNIYSRVSNFGDWAQGKATGSRLKSIAKNDPKRFEKMRFSDKKKLFNSMSPVKGAVRGAAIGTVAGAGYGAWSDQDTMISGAMKGAILGAVGGAIWNKSRGGFSRRSKPINPQSSANGNTRSQFPRDTTSTRKSKFRTPPPPEQGPSMDIGWGARTREAMNRPKNMRTPQDFRDIDIYNSNATAYGKYKDESSIITGRTKTHTGYRETYKI